jgi:hypothetical protein
MVGPLDCPLDWYVTKIKCLEIYIFFYSNENRKDEKENEDIPSAVETASGTMTGN